VVGHLADPVFGAVHLDALAEFRQGRGKRRLGNPQAEIWRFHKPAHVDLLVVAHAADEHEQVDGFPPRPDAVLSEELAEIGKDFGCEVHAGGTLSIVMRHAGRPGPLRC
jgi:hypothetical protein